MDSIRQSIPAFGLMEYTVTWDNLSHNNSNNDNNNNNSDEQFALDKQTHI